MIVEHPPVVQVLEAVRAADVQRPRIRAEFLQDAEPEPFGAGGVHDVESLALEPTKDRLACPPGRHQLTNMSNSRSANLVIEDDFAPMAERAVTPPAA